MKDNIRISLFVHFAVTAILFCGCEKDQHSYWEQINQGFFDLPVNILTADTAAQYVYGYCSGEKKIYRSADFGNNWSEVNNLSGQLNSIINNGNSTFAGFYGNGVFRSTDNGSNWTAVNNGLLQKGFQVTSLALSGGDIFATTDGGVFMSSDNGNSWNAVNTGLPTPITKFFFGAYHLSDDPRSLAVSGNKIFTGTYGKGVFLTVNKGSSWTAVNNGLSTSELKVNSLAISNNNIFIGTSNGILISSDNGTNWNKATDGLPSGTFSVNKLVTLGDKVFCMYSENFSAVNKVVCLSSDNGKSWKSVTNGLSGELYSLAVCGSSIFAGTLSGVFRSDNNGSNWVPVVNNLSKPVPSRKHIKSIALNGDIIFAGTEGFGVYMSTDAGSNWTAVNKTTSDLLLNGKDVCALALNGNNIVAGTSGSGIFVSADKGSSWKAMNAGLSVNGLFVWSLAFSGSNLFAGTSDGVFLSADMGNSWTAVRNGLPAFDLIVNDIVAIGNNVFAATMGEGIFLSSDNGTTWTGVNQGLASLFDQPAPSLRSAKTVLSLASDGSTIFAGTSSGVFRSTNNGESWTSVSKGLETSYGLHVIDVAVSGKYLMAATGGGAFLSTNEGETWTAVNHGSFKWIPDIFTLAINEKYVFAGTATGVNRWRYIE